MHLLRPCTTLSLPLPCALYRKPIPGNSCLIRRPQRKAHLLQWAAGRQKLRLSKTPLPPPRLGDNWRATLWKWTQYGTHYRRSATVRMPRKRQPCGRS